MDTEEKDFAEITNGAVTLTNGRSTIQKLSTNAGLPTWIGHK